MGHVEDAPFHLLQQLAEIVIIKGQSPLRRNNRTLTQSLGCLSVSLSA